jgi:hypothetical protein
MGMKHAPIAAGSNALAYERRGDRRIDTVFAVAVEAAERSQISRIVELSRMGARLQVGLMLPVGQAVVLRRSGVELRGQVTWQKGNSVGVGFTEPLEERLFLQLRRHTG